MYSLPGIERAVVLATLLTLPLSPVAQTTGDQPAHGSPATVPNRVVARVNGLDLRVAEVRRAFNRILPMQGFHGAVDEAKVHEIARKATQEAIDRELAVQDARARGIEASPEEIDDKLAGLIRRYESKAAFDAKLRQAGVGLERVRDGLAHDAVAEKVATLVARRDEVISDQETKAYYEANLERFREPVRAEVRQIMLKMPPTGRTEELWKAKEAEAAKLAERARAGEDFAALAREYSEVSEAQKAKGGLIGAFHKGQLAEFLDAVVWKLEPGEISEPVRSFYGVHVVKVDRLLPARQVPYQEIADKLRAHLQKERARQRVTEWRAALRARARIEYLDPFFAPEGAAIAKE